MIEIGFNFANERLSLLIETLLDLPKSLRPKFFSHGEKIRTKKDSIDDRIRFDTFIEKASSGFCLFSDKLLFNFLIAKNVDTQLFIDGASEEDAKLLVQRLSGCSPSFGYAAHPAEHKHRNTVSKQAFYGHQTAGVGNDWRRYVPGLYWLTVIPSSLAERHGVPLDKIKSEAVEVKEPTPGVWVLKFFTSPDEWPEHTEWLDRLCVGTPGIFSVTSVRPTFESAATFLETEAVLRPWR